MDMEKVIKGLAYCQYSSKSHCYECPYVYEGLCSTDYCTADLASDVFSLLKAQEAHIVTEKDFENSDTYGFLPAWCEERDVEHVYCECITKGALSEKGMRYWTAKPTDEQRKAVKWDD